MNDYEQNNNFLKFNKTYNFNDFENQIKLLWQKNNCFKAKINSNKPHFSVVLPPPNITGKLHMGHALNITLQDIIVRFKRMNGFETLWVPGVDHAAIATEAKIVQMLKQQGKSKNEIGRENFLKIAFEWKKNLESTIFEQIKSLGASCDFSRSRFTMDEGCKEAVVEFFVNLFNSGLIYRGERVVNWCFKCGTSISDAEVNYEQKKGFLWHLKYKFADDEQNFIEIATTRPETLFGDVAVAVNPLDLRYKNLIGKKVVVPLINKLVPIIADEFVDLNFGSGAVKITPAHDFDDFEVGIKHHLKIVKVFDSFGKLNENTGSFCGLDVKQARNAVVDELQQQGYVLKTTPYVHNVGQCYRCATTIEPLISKQWFVKMKFLKQAAIDVIKNKKFQFIPNYFEKTYLNWLNIMKDWCVSRQLWWGHAIPAWHCNDCENVMVAKTKPKKCNKCLSVNLIADTDTLDTWFSSALWPFSTLGWPKKTDYFNYFYPTSVLVTGYDIIFFWVIRMVVAALQNTGQVPFKKVFIHGIVRDSSGKKMSKSLGNGIDPLDIINQVGADALRLVLASNTNPGSDIRWSNEKVLAARNFVNKLWNASRFIYLNVQKFNFKNLNKLPNNLQIDDLWILTKLKNLINEVSHNVEQFEISVAIQKLYDFVWDVFCSWFVELTKIRLLKTKQEAFNALSVLMFVLHNVLKLLHPFLPFVTEKINLLMFGENSTCLAISNWPKFDLNFDFKEGVEFEKIMECVRKIRNVRTEMNIKNTHKIKIFIETNFIDLFKKCSHVFINLTFASEVKIKHFFDVADVENFIKLATDSARIFVDLEKEVDTLKQKQCLLKEQKNCQNEIDYCKQQLSNKQFVSKAPKQILEKQQNKLNAAILKLKKINQSLNELNYKEN